jgi:hypothetical protein
LYNKIFGKLDLARYVADMLPTCRRHVHMSPISCRHCMSIGPDICSFCQKLPTPPQTMPPKKTKRLAGARATAHAGDAAAAPADAAAPPADAAVPPADAAAPPPIEPYFGAHGEATIRAASLPRLPGFEAF